jgi:hypothetical protein
VTAAPLGVFVCAGTFRSLELGFRIRCNDEALAGALAELYDACRADETETVVELELLVSRDRTGSGYEILANETLCARMTEWSAVLEWCAWRVNQSAAERDNGRLVLHAAAAERDERAVVLAGPSGAGKSTLVSALGLRGLAYMGDDGVQADLTGRILSNPKPISLDAAARAALMTRNPTVTALREPFGVLAPGRVARVVPSGHAVEPVVVIRPEFRSGARPRLTALRAADVAEILADQSFNFAALGAKGLATVAAIARATSGYHLTFGHADRAADAIESVL